MNSSQCNYSQEKNEIGTDYRKRLEGIKENFANAQGLWKKDEDNRLTYLNSENKTIDEISRILRRQSYAVRYRLRKLGLLIQPWGEAGLSFLERSKRGG